MNDPLKDELTSSQRKILRGRAHALRPVVTVGQHGLSESVQGEIEHSLEHHELIKIRLSGDRHERREQLDAVVAATDCSIVGAIGAVAVLFRPARDPKHRRIDPKKL